MNAPPALLHPARPLPHSHDLVSMTAQLCGADFARRTCFWAGVVDHVRPCPIGWPRRSQSTGLTDVVCPRRCDDWRHSSGPSVGLPRTSVWICWTLPRYLLRFLT